MRCFFDPVPSSVRETAFVTLVLWARKMSSLCSPVGTRQLPCVFISWTNLCLIQEWPEDGFVGDGCGETLQARPQTLCFAH